jgi:hypothetical protein
VVLGIEIFCVIAISVVVNKIRSNLNPRRVIRHATRSVGDNSNTLNRDECTPIGLQ